MQNPLPPTHLIKGFAFELVFIISSFKRKARKVAKDGEALSRSASLLFVSPLRLHTINYLFHSALNFKSQTLQPYNLTTLQSMLPYLAMGV